MINDKVSNYMRHKMIELQGEINESIIIVGDFNTPLSEMDKNRGQKISEDIVELNNTINQLNILDIYRLLHPIRTECSFFSSSHGTFPKMDHILGAKTHLNKFKRMKIIQCLLLDHNGIKLEINNRKITLKIVEIEQYTSK